MCCATRRNVLRSRATRWGAGSRSKWRAAPARGSAAPGEAGRRAVLLNRALDEGIGAIAADWGLPMLAPRHRAQPELVQPLFDMVKRMSGAIYQAQTRALLGRPDATDVLQNLDCQTLILCGEEDGWSPPERHRHMAALVPHAVLRLVPDCGHMSTMEQPQAVLGALREWLALPARPFAPEACHGNA
jgi:pimeloyl-ACP methyl ester carboxylesterase